MKTRIFIEYPSAGATYCRDEYGIYAYDTYPEGSVLEGQTRRRFLGSFERFDEARKHYPTAIFVECSLYTPPDLSHLPDDEDY